MSFTAKERKVYDLFNRNCYKMPHNQRKYVWKKRNWQEIYDDIKLVVKGFEPTHFIGSIVLYQDKDRENGVSSFTIIDGQQRITTLAIYISCIAFWLKYYNAESEFNGVKQYIVARDDYDKDWIMVTTEAHLSLEAIMKKIVSSSFVIDKSQSIDSFINSNILDSGDENVADCFKFFLNQISNDIKVSDDPVALLSNIKTALIEKILYVSIIATNEEDAYTIFEILNARGAALQDHELLKNYIMKGIEDNYGIEKVKIAWKNMENNVGKSINRFFKHYSVHKYNRVKNDELSDYMVIRSENKGKHTSELLEDILLKSTFYKKLIAPSHDEYSSNCSEREYKVFRFLKTYRQEQFRPIFLSLIHQHTNGLISEENYNTTLMFLFDFFICYNIIGEEKSNRISNLVASKAFELENNYSDYALMDLIDKMKKKLPAKDNFINSFCLVGWSHHNGFYDDEKYKNKVQIILEMLERYKRVSNECEKFTIEHIIDDSKTEECAKIGNLVPVEASINEQCNGKDFEQKIVLYRKSGFITTRNFADRYAEGFSINDIDSRTRFMAKEFYDKILDLQPVIIEQESEKINRQQSSLKIDDEEKMDCEQLSFF